MIVVIEGEHVEERVLKVSEIPREGDDVAAVQILQLGEFVLDSFCSLHRIELLYLPIVENVIEQ